MVNKHTKNKLSEDTSYVTRAAIWIASAVCISFSKWFETTSTTCASEDTSYIEAHESHETKLKWNVLSKIDEATSARSSRHPPADVIQEITKGMPRDRIRQRSEKKRSSELHE